MATACPAPLQIAFGLNPNSAADADGAGGDPDGDGRTNLEEFQAQPSTHPRGFERRYLAEGAVNAFFSTQIDILNPGAQAARTLVRIQPEGQTERTHRDQRAEPQASDAVDADARRAHNGAVLDRRRVRSPLVGRSDDDLGRDRLRVACRDGGRRPVADVVSGRGRDAGDSSCSTCCRTRTRRRVGDGALPAPGGRAAGEDVHAAAAAATNIWVNVDDAGSGWPSTDVSARSITSDAADHRRAGDVSDRPGQLFAAGHESAGVTAPATSWFLAEGATGAFFDLFVLVANPSATAAQVDGALPDRRAARC